MSSDLYNIRHAPGSMIRKVASLGFSTLSRFMDIRRAESADVLFVHREAFPVGGPFIEEKLAWQARRWCSTLTTRSTC